jgi:hypothetical protein
MDSETPIDASSEPYEFASCTLKKSENLVYTNGIRGTRERIDHRIVSASYAVTGNITLNPSVTELDRLLPRMLGGETAGGVTDIAETIPEFVICVDKVRKVYTYAGCKIVRWTLSSAEGQPIELSLDIEGQTESEAASGTFPSLTIDTDDVMAHSDSTLTLSGASIPVKQWSLTVDHMCDTARFMNSETRAEIPAHDLSVQLSCLLGWTDDTEDLYDTGASGVEGSLALSDGTSTYTWNFGLLVSSAQGVEVPGKGEVMLPMTYDAYKSGDDSQIKCTKT